NKSRAAKQGETTPRTAPSTLFKRSRAAGNALAPAAAPKAHSGIQSSRRRRVPLTTAWRSVLVRRASHVAKSHEFKCLSLDRH
ncbi:hypothetical protein HaLaN_29822, partial [Haematococcus lacustris]